MKKLFISQPMRGLADKEILNKREEIIKDVEKLVNEKVEIIDSFIKEYPGEINKTVPVWYLGKSLQFLSQADYAYFDEGWKDARGCRIEHEVAVQYGIKIVGE